MKVFSAPHIDKHHYHDPPQRLRDFHCLYATALDAARFPIFARHWPGFLIIGGALAAHDHAPAVRRWEAKHDAGGVVNTFPPAAISK